ncbi:MAG: O-antigen ligase family protein [Candidatus Tritonobacter lacicola]|nr:O-antigen ligase family protein [Candidatus Tritonobacter lacicola]
MKGEKKISWGYILSFLRWAAWITVFCAIVLTLEVATGYISITGKEANPAFAIFVLIILAAIALTRPDILFFTAVFFMPLLTMAFPGIAFVRGHLANMEVVHPLIFCALLGWFFKALKRGDPLVEGNPLTLPIFLFLAWAAFSLTWSVGPRFAKWQLLDLSFGVMIYITAVKVIGSRVTLERTVKTWIFSGILLTGLGLYFIATGAAGRVDVMTGHPNIFSRELNLIIMLVIAMLYIREQGFIPRWLLVPLLIIMLLVDLLTGSRAGFFALLAVVLFFLFSYYSINKQIRHISLVLCLFVVLLAGAVFLFALNPFEGVRIGFRAYNPAEFAEEETFLFRIELWKMAWEHIRESGQYFQGLGIMSFLLLYLEKYKQFSHTHSIYVGVGVHYGLVGLVLFAWIIAALVRQFRAGLRAAQSTYYQVMLRAMAAGLLAFAIHGIVDFDVETCRSIWLYVGVSMAAARLARKDGGRRTIDD